MLIVYLRARGINMVKAAILAQYGTRAALQHDAGKAGFVIRADIMKGDAGCLAAVPCDSDRTVAQRGFNKLSLSCMAK